MAGVIRQIWSILRDCFTANPEPLTKAQVLAWIGKKYPDQFNPSTLAAQLNRSCLNISYAQKYKAPKFLIYNNATKTYSVGTQVVEQTQLTQIDDESEHLTEDSDADQEAEETADSTFALEAHLRDYLARNLSSCLEKGMSLWCDSPPSVEYAIDGRRIDLLAKDSNGIPVVVELKLNRGYSKVVGQALLYQALVSRHLNADRVRIILVAAEIRLELKLACSRLVDVDLYEYALSMQTKKVSSAISAEEEENGSSR